MTLAVISSPSLAQDRPATNVSDKGGFGIVNPAAKPRLFDEVRRGDQPRDARRPQPKPKSGASFSGPADPAVFRYRAPRVVYVSPPVVRYTPTVRTYGGVVINSQNTTVNNHTRR